MAVAQGILTATRQDFPRRGSPTGLGKCCIGGAETLDIDYKTKSMKDGKSGKVVKEGEWLTLERSEGGGLRRQIAVGDAGIPKAYQTIMKWADGIRKIGVRTNADTPQTRVKAIEFGRRHRSRAPEHMFFTDFEFPEKGV